MGYAENCFQILGIEKTTDKRIIKKAYSEKVKACHPEDDPQSWKQLHDAYEEALKYAQEGQTSSCVQIKQSEEEPYEEEPYEEEPYVDELQQLFGELEAHSQQKKEQLKAAYGQKLAGLENCSYHNAYEKWKELFEDPHFMYYCRMDGFWDEFLEVLEKARLNGQTRTYILGRLSDIENQYANEIGLTNLHKVLSAKKICQEKSWFYRVWKSRWGKEFIFAGIFVAFCLLVSIDTDIYEKQSVAKEITGNLNEKYGNSYSTWDFYVSEESDLVAYDGKLKFYKAWLKEDRECMVFYLIYEDAASSTDKILQLDNFQKEEIEDALQEFFQQETLIRSEWVEIDEDSFANMNGRCAFWFPDRDVVDMKQWMEDPRCSYVKEDFEAVKDMEESYHIQILAAAFPQSYYENLEEVINSDDRERRNDLRRFGTITPTELPLGMPFVTAWYQTDAEADASELHSVQPQKLEDGIYLMNSVESEELAIRADVEKKDKQIAIQLFDDDKKLTSFILILDMKKLGIDEENYCVKEEAGSDKVSYGNISYTATGWERDAWCGEAIYFTDYSKVKSVSSSKKSIVKVEKDKERNTHANLYAKKTGKSVVTIKTGSGTTKYNVTVKKLDVSVKMSDMGGGNILLTVKNNTKQTFDDVTIEYTLKDPDGNVFDKEQVNVYDVVAGKTVYKSIYYSAYTYSVDIEQSSGKAVSASHNPSKKYKNQSSNISVSDKIDGDKLILTTKNKAKNVNVSGCNYILFYDASGKVIDLMTSSLYLKAGEVDTSSKSLYGVEYDHYVIKSVGYSYTF